VDDHGIQRSDTHCFFNPNPNVRVSVEPLVLFVFPGHTMTSSQNNTLGLDFDHLRIQSPSDSPPSQGELVLDSNSTTDSQQQPLQQDAHDQSTPEPENQDSKERKRPYINPERVRTGGTQRVSEQWYLI
jgi:hypothetical protein